MFFDLLSPKDMIHPNFLFFLLPLFDQLPHTGREIRNKLQACLDHPWFLTWRASKHSLMFFSTLGLSWPEMVWLDQVSSVEPNLLWSQSAISPPSRKEEAMIQSDGSGDPADWRWVGINKSFSISHTHSLRLAPSDRRHSSRRVWSSRSKFFFFSAHSQIKHQKF